MLQVLVTHNIRIRGASVPLRAEITKALTIDNPAYLEKKRRRQPTWGVESKLAMFTYDRGDLVAPRGFLEDLNLLLKARGIHTPDVVRVQHTRQETPVEFGWNEGYQLKDDQQPAVAAICERNGILVAPAGSGKTLMGMKYIQQMEQPAIWITHTTDLMYQAKKDAERYLSDVGDVGILGDGKQVWGSGKLIVATVQTLAANPNLVETLNPLIGTVVVDECHHFPSQQFLEVVGRFAAVNLLGLTATPDRKDQLEIYMYRGIGPKVYEISRDGLYEAGRLIKPDVKFVYTEFDFEQASTVSSAGAVDAGGEDLDYRELLDKLIADEKRNKLIVDNILLHVAGNYSIVLTDSVRHAHELHNLVVATAQRRTGTAPRTAVIHGSIQQYTWKKARSERHAQSMVASGVAVESRKHATAGWQVKVPAYTPEEFEAWQITGRHRKEILRQAGQKQIDILFATGQLVREGLDLPHLNVGHLTMPARGDRNGDRSGAAIEQAIGRIMRPDPSNPGKKALWFDYVDHRVGVLNDQYRSRRSVYTRIGLTLPRRPKTKRDDLVDLLNSIQW